MPVSSILHVVPSIRIFHRGLIYLLPEEVGHDEAGTCEQKLVSPEPPTNHTTRIVSDHPRPEGSFSCISFQKESCCN